MTSPCQPEPSRDSEPASSDTRSAQLRVSTPGGRGRGPGDFGTSRGSSRRGGTQAARGAPRPAAARSGPEGEQATSTEVSAVAGRARAVCGPGNPIPARGQRGRLARAPALAATDSGGSTARSPGVAAGHGGGRRWARGAVGTRARPGRAAGSGRTGPRKALGATCPHTPFPALPARSVPGLPRRGVLLGSVDAGASECVSVTIALL